MPKSLHADIEAARVRPTLRVILRSGMVQDVKAMLEGATRRYVGARMVHDRSSADYGKWITTDLVEEVEHDADSHYLRAICEGHLAAADDATAKLAAAWGKKDPRTLLATKEELDLAAKTLAALKDQDKKNEDAARAAKVVASPGGADADPTKMARAGNADLKSPAVPEADRRSPQESLPLKGA
jgi:hypothetical protein